MSFCSGRVPMMSQVHGEHCILPLVRFESLPAFVVIMLTWGCATAPPPPPPPPPRIDYSLPSVPQEGGISFTRLTEDEETVIRPRIRKTRQGRAVSYSPRQIFSISKKKIAYVGKKNKKDNVFIKNLAGGRAVQQRTFSEDVYDVSYSPDGENLAFADKRDGSVNIYTIESESGFAIRQITRSRSPSFFPVFSPDNSKILFYESQGARSYLWTYDLTNGALTQYVEGAGSSFTPDGKRIASVRTNRETGFSEVWLVDIEKGQEYVVLSSRDRGFHECSVSPDGKKIAVVSSSFRVNTPVNLDIFVVNIDGSSLAQLTFHPGHDFCPRWAHDGLSLYFVSQRGTEDGKFNIWHMKLK